MLQTSVASHLANPRQIFLRLADVIKQHLDRQQNVIAEVQEDRVNMIKALRSLELQTLPPLPPKQSWDVPRRRGARFFSFGSCL